MKKLFIAAFAVTSLFSANAQINDVSVTPNSVNVSTEEKQTYYGPHGTHSESFFKLETALLNGKKFEITSSSIYNYIYGARHQVARFGYDDNFLELREAGTIYALGTLPHLYSNRIISGELSSQKLIVGLLNGDYIPSIWTANGNYKMFVAGGLMAEEVNIKLKNQWADYVFAPDYKLLSLEDTKQFINKNNHLPGIPSANEVSANGLTVGEMSIKHMEKIEELTLHLIQVNEEKNALQDEVESLNARLEKLEALLSK